MKYISIDIETTGLDPEYCQVIEVGAIIDDLSKNEDMYRLPMFQTYIMHDKIVGEPYALSMHSAIFKRMSKAKDMVLMTPSYDPIDKCVWMDNDGYSYVYKDNFWIYFLHWLQQNDMINDRINVAGKNFGSFDKQFLNKLPNWGSIGSRLRHRFLDPGMLYLQNGDVCIPDTKTCMERAGIPGDVEHTALGDAEVVIKLIRHKLGDMFR